MADNWQLSMKWLLELDTNDDPISACRLLNIFRRKGLKIITLAMAPRTAGFTLLAVVEFAESELGHVFNYLRRTEGVERVTCFRHDESAEASFIWVDSGGQSADEIIKKIPASKLVFSSFGKYFLKVPSGNGSSSSVAGWSELGCLPFVRVMATEDVGRAETVGVFSK